MRLSIDNIASNSIFLLTIESELSTQVLFLKMLPMRPSPALLSLLLLVGVENDLEPFTDLSPE